MTPPTSLAVRFMAAEDTGKAGPLGLLVLILLGIVCYFLFRSMSRHLRKVRDDFPVEPVDEPTPERPTDFG